MKTLTYEYGVDNIFDYWFMEDFTTICILEEEGKDISHLDFRNEDDFYCYSENKTYTEEDLFKKFNIKRVGLKS